MLIHPQRNQEVMEVIEEASVEAEEVIEEVLEVEEAVVEVVEEEDLEEMKVWLPERVI